MSDPDRRQAGPATSVVELDNAGAAELFPQVQGGGDVRLLLAEESLPAAPAVRRRDEASPR